MVLARWTLCPPVEVSRVDLFCVVPIADLWFLGCTLCGTGERALDCGQNGLPGTCPPGTAASRGMMDARAVSGIVVGVVALFVLAAFLVVKNRARKPVEDQFDIRDYWWGLEESVVRCCSDRCCPGCLMSHVCAGSHPHMAVRSRPKAVFGRPFHFDDEQGLYRRL